MSKIDNSAFFNIGYGLYLVTSRLEDRDNGMIVNSVMQVTNTPQKLIVAINKDAYSHDIIKQTKIMNVHCLDKSAKFSIFENFGMKSGKNTDKFDKVDFGRTENGLAFVKESVNTLFCLEVESYIDMETHGVFVCSVISAEVFNSNETMTYSYYQKNVKPQPEKKKKGFVCTVCGYIHESDTLPDDFVCPLCLHSAEVFEPIK